MDITMCQPVSCPYADTCLRATQDPNPFWQSYAEFELTCNEGSGFEDYIKDYRTKDK